MWMLFKTTETQVVDFVATVIDVSIVAIVKNGSSQN